MTFFAKHRMFTLTPRMCFWPDRGWSLWWLWFEVAKIDERHIDHEGPLGSIGETSHEM